MGASMPVSEHVHFVAADFVFHSVSQFGEFSKNVMGSRSRVRSSLH